MTIKQNAKEALKACQAPIFKGYLVWVLQRSRIKKESTIIIYWEVIRMWYAQETGLSMNSAVMHNIRNVQALLLLFSL